MKNKPINETEKNNNIIINVIPKKCMNYDILHKTFIDFIETKILIPVEFNEIQIYEIKYLRNEKTIEIDNPDYEKFIEQQQMIKDIQSSNKEAHIDISTLTFETRKIKKTEIIEELKCYEINKCKKNINSLYLRKNDIETLVCVLDQFKNNIELYNKLDIPRKLGFLLYGKPGTGKSTTIKAIATYLKKNIYYVNLNNVAKNSQLKNIFDYITLNCANGGIIVFEDIDCMTNIVAPREENIETSIINSLSQTDDSISLSYFLNLLDGTLTVNECVFIITTNHINKLDKAIYRPGRIDVVINFKLCDHYQIINIYKNLIGRDIDYDILQKIQENKYTPAEIIFHLIQNIYNRNEDDNVIMRKFIIE